MDTQQYANWQAPCPVAGKYEIKVEFAENWVGTNPDANGEVSTGMKFIYEIVGPPEAMMDNKTSAIGYKFDELLLEPKQSSSAKYVEMCSQKWNHQLHACFGDQIPATVLPEDFLDRVFVATAKPKFDDFKQKNIPNLGWRGPLGS